MHIVGLRGLVTFSEKALSLLFHHVRTQPDGGPQVKKSVPSISGLTGTPILDPWIPEL